MMIAVDFDGTIVENEYPKIGKEKPYAVDTLKALSREGHRIILWTSRSGRELEDAVFWCRLHGLFFYAVNSNTPNQPLTSGTEAGSGFRRPGILEMSPKIVPDMFIDDKNFGGLPSWREIYKVISRQEHRSFSIFRRHFHRRSRSSQP